MRRPCVAGLLVVGIALMSVAPVLGKAICKPTLAFTQVHFAPMQLPKRERTWTAILSVDASRCATTSGRFSILFTRLKENAPDMEFREVFAWQPGSLAVAVEFWLDEAVGAYRIDTVAPSPCSR